MRKFTDILEEYLDVREQLNSDHYENHYIASRTDAMCCMLELANELNAIVEKVTNEQQT
tara:strand:- start:695 stop:871 length:177 start_codon:yes stop_codon:yes gene_type:complete